MTKYGFDYFLNTLPIINEMARPSPLLDLGEHGAIASEIFNSIGQVMRKGGEVNGEVIPGLGGNREKNRQLRYFIYMLANLDKEQTEDSINDSEASSEIVDIATQILDIPKETWRKMFNDPDKLYRAAILKGVDGPFKDRVLSPEFRRSALDPTNILSYVSTNRLPNPYSIAKAKQRAEAHGRITSKDPYDTSILTHAAELDAAETGIKDIITKIHRAIHARKMKKNPDLASKEAKSSSGVSNDFIDNVYFILNAIDNIRYYHETIQKLAKQRASLYDSPKDVVMSIIDDYPNMQPELITTLYTAKNIEPFLNQMEQEYSKLKPTGIDLKSLYKQLDSFRENGDPEIVDAIETELDDLISKSEEVDVGATSGPTEGQEFAGYPQDIIDTFLTNPQDKEQFRKYHTWKTNDMIARANKIAGILHSMKWGEGEVPGERDIVRKASKEFWEKRPEGDGSKAFNSDLQKSLGPVQRNESYVMEYMTEQVSKDRFKPKGQFRDRGCKKMNYLEWLERNQ